MTVHKQIEQQFLKIINSQSCVLGSTEQCSDNICLKLKQTAFKASIHSHCRIFRQCQNTLLSNISSCRATINWFNISLITSQFFKRSNNVNSINFQYLKRTNHVSLIIYNISRNQITHLPLWLVQPQFFWKQTFNILVFWGAYIS